MNVLLLLVGWMLLVAICWPLALLCVLLAPLVWMVALPFLLVGVVLGALFAFIKALLFLPARILGH